MRNVWGEIDVVRDAAYTVPFTFTDPGADRVVGTATTRPSTPSRCSRASGQDRVFTNTDDDADFHNVEFAVNRRFSDRWMLLTSFGHTWSTMYHVNTAGNAARPPITTTTYRPIDRLFGDDGLETSTLWNYKAIGRYVMTYDIGLSGSWKVQSGYNYAPHDQREPAGRRRAHGARRADHRQPLPDGANHRRPRRQDVRRFALRQG